MWSMFFVDDLGSSGAAFSIGDYPSHGSLLGISAIEKFPPWPLPSQSGDKKGDRVASFMPNIPETLVAFFATASIGAIWSSCSPDFGTRSVIDRSCKSSPKFFLRWMDIPMGGRPLRVNRPLPGLQEVLRVLKRPSWFPTLIGMPELRISKVLRTSSSGRIF